MRLNDTGIKIDSINDYRRKSSSTTPFVGNNKAPEVASLQVGGKLSPYTCEWQILGEVMTSLQKQKDKSKNLHGRFVLLDSETQRGVNVSFKP